MAGFVHMNINFVKKPPIQVRVRAYAVNCDSAVRGFKE